MNLGAVRRKKSDGKSRKNRKRTYRASRPLCIEPEARKRNNFGLETEATSTSSWHQILRSCSRPARPCLRVRSGQVSRSSPRNLPCAVAQFRWLRGASSFGPSGAMIPPRHLWCPRFCSRSQRSRGHPKSSPTAGSVPFFVQPIAWLVLVYSSSIIESKYQPWERPPGIKIRWMSWTLSWQPSSKM